MYNLYRRYSSRLQSRTTAGLPDVRLRIVEGFDEMAFRLLYPGAVVRHGEEDSRQGRIRLKATFWEYLKI